MTKPYWRIFYHKPRKKFQVQLRFRGKPQLYVGSYSTRIGALIGRNQELFNLFGAGGLAIAWKLQPQLRSKSLRHDIKSLIEPGSIEPRRIKSTNEDPNLNKFFAILNPKIGDSK